MKYTLKLTSIAAALFATWGCASSQQSSPGVETAVDENEPAVEESEETAEEWREESAEETTDGAPQADAVNKEDPADLKSEDLNSTAEDNQESE